MKCAVLKVESFKVPSWERELVADRRVPEAPDTLMGEVVGFEGADEGSEQWLTIYNCVNEGAGYDIKGHTVDFSGGNKRKYDGEPNVGGF